VIHKYTLHESGNLGKIKKMSADEIFALQNSTLLQCYLQGCQLFSLISAKRNAFYAKCFH